MKINQIEKKNIFQSLGSKVNILVMFVTWITSIHKKEHLKPKIPYWYMLKPNECNKKITKAPVKMPSFVGCTQERGKNAKTNKIAVQVHAEHKQTRKQ